MILCNYIRTCTYTYTLFSMYNKIIFLICVLFSCNLHVYLIQTSMFMHALIGTFTQRCEHVPTVVANREQQVDITGKEWTCKKG